MENNIEDKVIHIKEDVEKYIQEIINKHIDTNKQTKDKYNYRVDWIFGFKIIESKYFLSEGDIRGGDNIIYTHKDWLHSVSENYHEVICTICNDIMLKLVSTIEEEYEEKREVELQNIAWEEGEYD